MYLAPATQASDRSALLHSDAEHRLANMLQLVGANLLRAARVAAHGPARTAMQDAVAQLNALGRLHRTLAGLHVEAGSNAAKVLEHLCTSLDALLVTPAGHRLRFCLDDSAVDAVLGGEVLHCLVAVATEFVVNAVKHAFPVGQAGSLHVLLALTPAGLAVTVRDNGSGAPQQPCKAAHGRGQGTALAELLADAVGGSCRRKSGPDGTAATVVVPHDATGRPSEANLRLCDA